MTKSNALGIDFQEDGNKDGYVVVCKHIAFKTRPVLLMEMNPPYDPEHSGWEALCNQEGECAVEDYIHWSMKDLLEYEPSLKDLLKDPIELPMIHRDAVGSPWKVIK